MNKTVWQEPRYEALDFIETDALCMRCGTYAGGETALRDSVTGIVYLVRGCGCCFVRTTPQGRPKEE